MYLIIIKACSYHKGSFTYATVNCCAEHKEKRVCIKPLCAATSYIPACPS